MNINKYEPAPRNSPTCYPGTRPPESYLFGSNNIIPIKITDRLEDSDADGMPLPAKLKTLEASPLEERYPIIGYGSNANPVQLQSKFKGKDAVIPVLRGMLDGYDVVYANSFASYGSVPATITESSKTKVQVWVNLLDKHQLAIMDKTEGRNIKYCMGKLYGKVVLNGGTSLESFSYIHADGVLDLGEGPIRLKTIPAENPKFMDLDQCQILQKLSKLWKIDKTPEMFAENIAKNCEHYRKKLSSISNGMQSTGYTKIIDDNPPTYSR